MTNSHLINIPYNLVWRSSKLSLSLKKRLGKALVWSVALYGCESWTLRRSDGVMIAAFEMWVWRRILRINWHDKLLNEWVRTRLGLAAKNELLAAIRKRKLAKYCHWKRRPDSFSVKNNRVRRILWKPRRKAENKVGR